MQVRSLGQEDPLEEAWQPSPIFWSGESHGQRILAGYGPQDHTESEMSEASWHACMHPGSQKRWGHFLSVAPIAASPTMA